MVTMLLTMSTTGYDEDWLFMTVMVTDCIYD